MTADKDAVLSGEVIEASTNGADVPVNDNAALARELQDFISRNPNIFGGADIFNIEFRNPQIRVGILAAVLACLVDNEGRPAVLMYTIVVPPGSNEAEAQGAAWNEFTTFRALTAVEDAWYKSRFRFVVAADRQSRSLVDIFEKQPERTAVIVTDAASYREDSINPYIPPGASTPLLAEDVWAPQLHGLASSAVEVARKRNLYVALDTGRISPIRQVMTDLLLSIDGCGVLGSSKEEDPYHVLAERVDQWDAWIQRGHLGRVLRDIEHLPAKFEPNKAFLRIQMLHKAGFFLQALQAMREEIATGRKLDVQSRVKLARIAKDANAFLLARDILAPAVAEFGNREDLESALATAEDAGLEEIEGKLAQRLAELFPGAESLQLRRQRRLLASRNYAEVAAIKEKSADQQGADFYKALARSLSGPEVPDYPALIASGSENVTLSESYRMACVYDALERKLVAHAFDLAMPLPKSSMQASRGERFLLRILEELLLYPDKSGNFPVSAERLQAALLSLVERLAGDPHNRVLRIGLARLLQPTVAGTAGLALIASIVMQLASRPIRIEKERPSGEADLTWLSSHKPFVKVALAWLKGEEPVVIGRSVLPKEFLTEPADEAISAISSYLAFAPLNSADDIDDLQLWLALVAAITPHGSDPDLDLQLIRLTAGKFASSGYAQAARDLVEQALQNSGATPRRRRLGWFAMADVYHRGHNYIEGLIAVACTLAADSVGDEDQVWHEITTVVRFLRDCGLHENARLTIGNARELVRHMNLSATHTQRLDTLELQIRQQRLEREATATTELETLLADVVRNGRAVLEHHDATEPVAVMLSQLLRHAKETGVSVPPGAEGVLIELSGRSKGSIASLISTMSAAEPSADDLLAVLRTTGSARYSDDVGFDMRNAALIASRALGSDSFIRSAVETSFALELLADRGVAVPGWDEIAEPPPAPEAITKPAQLACSISRDGLSVVQAGFDASGRLVRVSAVDGELEAPVRENVDVIQEERFKEWAHKYPYGYGLDPGTANLFYTTTANLRLSALPEGPVVIVADATFQPFPPNLIYVADEFAGRTRPIAAAPSLAWLQAARTRGAIGDGRLCAWISTAIGEGGSQTLPMIAQRLGPTLDQHKFLVDNGPTLPAAFAGASMAIITAHGGVHPEGRYFQVVTDEGVLRVTAADLANALRNIGVVILFVCSGGRADKHPGANTTLGLTKQILDRGCAAVVASPWPLDSRVPSHWLPEFMARWSEGDCLIGANFAANQIVDQQFSQDPARGLAMTVFGNPGLRRS